MLQLGILSGGGRQELQHLVKVHLFVIPLSHPCHPFVTSLSSTCHLLLSRCVPISSCSALLNLVAQVKMGDKEALGKLLASQCGFTRQLPMVCCPGRSKKRPKAALPPPTPPQRRLQPTQTPQAPQPTQTSLRPKPLPLEPRAPDFSKLNHPKCGTR